MDFICRAFVNPLLSDMCNAMRSLRRGLMEYGLVSLEYSCASHPMNNLCGDIISIPNFKVYLRRGLFLSKSIKNKGMVGKIFRVISFELYVKEYAMVL